MQGARRFLAEGFDPPDAVQAATAEYRRDEDVIGRFIEDELSFEAETWTASGDLAYQLGTWCKKHGVSDELGMKELAEALKAHGCTGDRKERDGKKLRGWLGVEIVNPVGILALAVV